MSIFTIIESNNGLIDIVSSFKNKRSALSAFKKNLTESGAFEKETISDIVDELRENYEYTDDCGWEVKLVQNELS